MAKKAKANSTVYYFEKSLESDSINSNGLKTFLQFLRSQKIKTPFKFSFCPESWSLTLNMTLEDDIYLDTISTAISSNERTTVESFLGKISNPYLLEIYKIIGDLSQFPNQYDYRTRKLVTILKTFMKPDPYIFLENPEKYLRDSDIAFLKKMISYEASEGRIVLISSNQYSSFENIVTHIVSKNPKKIFQVEMVEKENSEVSASILKFHIDDMKKAA